MSELFGRDIKTVGKPINNALNEELSNTLTVKGFLDSSAKSSCRKFCDNCHRRKRLSSGILQFRSDIVGRLPMFTYAITIFLF
jgi:hypothetical protein